MRTIVTLSFLLASSLAQAQQPDLGLTTTKLSDGLFMIMGAGGNIVLEVGKDAVFLVDDELTPLTPKLKAELAKITDKPVRFVVNTHWHGDHTGGNEAMGESGAVIVAHDNVRKRLSTGQFMALFNKKIPPAPDKALPVVTFADGLTFHLNGEEMQVFHVEASHTDGDAFVYFKKADLLHMGDNFTPAGYPFVDLASGGHVDGFIKNADRALTMVSDKTRVVGGHGPMGDKAKLKAWRDMLVTIRDRIQKLVAAGKSLADVKAARPTAEYDAVWGKGFMKPDVVVEIFFQDLSAKK